MTIILKFLAMRPWESKEKQEAYEKWVFGYLGVKP